MLKCNIFSWFGFLIVYSFLIYRRIKFKLRGLSNYYLRPLELLLELELRDPEELLEPELEPDQSALETQPKADRTTGETSAKQVFDRLAGTWTYWGWKGGYFDREEDARAYFVEMRAMLARQMGAPNSPQWFNTGLHWAYGID